MQDAGSPPWIPSRSDLPGLALAAAVGTLALICVRLLPPSPFLSNILVALGFGVLVLNTPLRHAIGLELPGPGANRYAGGIRFTGKWVLRLGIVLMGLKVQTSFFGGTEILLIAGAAVTAVPSAFFFAHAVGAWFGLRLPTCDLIATGTMICGSSAVNAVAPIARAEREEQGVAIGVIFLFSIVALLTFQPIAVAVGLDPKMAGLWSGLSVNDLSSAVAVGAQMGDDGAVMAAASKSARILLLAPALVILALLRRDGTRVDVRRSVVDILPGFILGYVALACARALFDRVAGQSPIWIAVVDADKLAVDFLLSMVAAGIGLDVSLRALLASSSRALALGGLTSVWMAALTLATVVAVSRGAPWVAAIIAVVGLATSFLGFRLARGRPRGGQELRPPSVV